MSSGTDLLARVIKVVNIEQTGPGVVDAVGVLYVCGRFQWPAVHVDSQVSVVEDHKPIGRGQPGERRWDYRRRYHGMVR